MINDVEPTYSIGDLVERRKIFKQGQFSHLNNYKAIQDKDVPDESIDLATIFVGFHHSPSETLNEFINVDYIY